MLLPTCGSFKEKSLLVKLPPKAAFLVGSEARKNCLVASISLEEVLIRQENWHELSMPFEVPALGKPSLRGLRGTFHSQELAMASQHRT